MENNIADILTNCEQANTAAKFVVNKETYKTSKTKLLQDPFPCWSEPVKYVSSKEDIFIVSDLHLASGKNELGVYKGTENFFADEAFLRFLEHASASKKTSSALLVINGDMFDFLRTTEFPGKVKVPRFTSRIGYYFKFGETYKLEQVDRNDVVSEYEWWSSELKKCGISKSPDELEKSISKNEKKYGLKTDDYKSIYKLMRIRKGHPAFFMALANWLSGGNRMIITKGNHDLELYWLNVRNYLRLILAEIIAGDDNVEDALTKIVIPNITFIDDALTIDETLFIEHGHRYDKYCMVLNSPVLSKMPTQLSIPFGSFFNRYLINVIELYYPNLDKVRPSGNVLPMLAKENFPLAVKMIFNHIPFLLRIITTNPVYFWYMFRRLVWWFLILLTPVILIAVGVLTHLSTLKILIASGKNISDKAPTFIKSALTSVLSLLPAYFLARVVAWFQLEEPTSLNDYAKKVFTDRPYKMVVMGHTHNPGSYNISPACRFFNTGTWIPIIEISTAEVREDRTYTFLHLTWQGAELILAGDETLKRWNDDAQRPDSQLLVERKG